MAVLGLTAIICLVFNVTFFVAASPTHSNINIRTLPGQSENGIIRAISNEIRKASLSKRDHDWKNSTTLDTSWNGAVLLQLDSTAKVDNTNVSVEAGIEVVCTTCYLKGVATGELFVADNFNISGAIASVGESLFDTIANFTEEAVDFVEQTVGNGWDSLFHHDDFHFPTFDYDFNINISAIPDAHLRFTFDGLELYMLIDTTLSLGATYTLNLFNSGRAYGPESVIGIHISDDLELGLIFTVDLILAAHGNIDVSSGFHLLLDDDFAIDIDLFGSDASGVHSNGGHFEFLPVQIESAGAVFSATLRVGAHVGLTLHTPDGPTIANHTLSAGGGIEAGVFANVAEFTTNVTAQPDDPACELGVAQSYQFALGASAGATIAFETHTWGPVATTSIPIFTADMTSACAIKGRTSVTSPAEITAAPTAGKRQDMSTATITSEATYTGVNCISTGLVDCPASLQSTVQSTTTSTMTTVVPSGIDEDEITWPVTIQSTVTSTATFKSATRLPSTSGSPVSYVAPPKSTSGGLVGEVKQDLHLVPEPVIIGVSVGLGVPLLLVLVIGLIVLLKRRAEYRAVPWAEKP